MRTFSILHIVDTLTIGGAEKLLVATIKSLKDYEHHLIYLGGSDALRDSLPTSCRVIKLNFGSKWDIPRCIFYITKYIKANKISIVHSHLVLSTFIARLACPKQVKLFSTLHSTVGARFFGAGKWFSQFMEKLIYRKRHHLIAVSEEVAKDYNKFIGIKGSCNVLPNFVDERFFRVSYKKRTGDGKLRMVAVGSLKEAKNYFYLLEAFSHLPENIQLDIYGEGALRSSMEQMIDHNNIAVTLKGGSENIHEILPDYDLFVMSSSVEGHPVALIEAMASGLPVMVSDIPAMKEAAGTAAIYFDLTTTGDFIKKVLAIADYKIDLDSYAEAGQLRIKSSLSRAQYMDRLQRIYNGTDEVKHAYVFKTY